MVMRIDFRNVCKGGTISSEGKNKFKHPQMENELVFFFFFFFFFFFYG
jgi:hypothetical protein